MEKDMTGLVDSFQRRINYMRISVTDRCDLSCIYCSDKLAKYLIHNDILRYEEILRVVQAASHLGVKKVRLTGGEALVRLHLSRLVAMLAEVEGIDEVSLTTNGTQLARFATELKESGLKRVNISLDTFRADRFREITGSDRLQDVLNGIKAARDAGLNPVKINMVVLRDVNDNEVLDFARKTVTEGWHVRYIEHMPFIEPGSVNSVVPIGEIIQRIEESLGGLTPVLPKSGNGPAKYYQLPGAAGRDDA